MRALRKENEELRKEMDELRADNKKLAKEVSDRVDRLRRSGVNVIGTDTHGLYCRLI